MLLSARELELVLFGAPDIDVNEWRRSTVYRGALEETSDVVEMFWAEVEGWPVEKRAAAPRAHGGDARARRRLRPALGRDGAVRPRALTSVSLDQAVYPRARGSLDASTASTCRCLRTGRPAADGDVARGRTARRRTGADFLRTVLYPRDAALVAHAVVVVVVVVGRRRGRGGLVAAAEQVRQRSSSDGSSRGSAFGAGAVSVDFPVGRVRLHALDDRARAGAERPPRGPSPSAPKSSAKRS